MIKGFREFLLRGNVVDLAVAVVIGAAFGKVIDAFATDFLGSILGKIVNADSFSRASIGFVNVGTTITALINFVIIAAAIYFFVVVPMNKLQSLRRPREADEAAAVPADVALLTEIRDLLARRSPQA
jgi:large conductance mechanosensitive channel